MNILKFDELDLSFVPTCVQRNERWRQCINLALASKSTDQRYGATLVTLDGTLIGLGYNRRKYDQELTPFASSFTLHAEQVAIVDTLKTRPESALTGSIMHIAGLLPRERRPLIRRSTMVDRGSCVRCARLYVRYGLNIAIMTEQGWHYLSGAKALENAQTYSRLSAREGRTKREFRKFISL